jgi:transglutaminase-like putative cysteine protease
VNGPASLLMPRHRRRSATADPASAEVPGSIAASPILDHETSEVRALVDRARRRAAGDEPLAAVEAAYALIRDEVRPRYAMEELTPTSRTLARGYGSCSQRLAVLESAARRLGIATRSRALLVDRAFWYPRFPRAHSFLPPEILLVWPEFEIAGEWRSAAELFGAIGCRGGGAFRNTGAETLFEAVGRCAVDWDGAAAAGDAYDLSRFVRADLGRFADRDEVFARFGQTLCAPSRAVVDPIMRRIAA